MPEKILLSRTIGPKFSVINQAFFHIILKVMKVTQTLTITALPEKNTCQHQGDFGPKSQKSGVLRFGLPDLAGGSFARPAQLEP